MLCGLVVAYLVQGMFVFDTLNTDVPLFFAMSLAVCFAGAFGATRTSLQSPKKWLLWLLPLIFLTFVFVQMRILAVDHKIADVKITTNQFDQDIASMLLSAANETYPAGHESKILLVRYAEQVIGKGVTPSDSSSFFLSAQQILERAAERDPHDTELILALGEFNNRFSQYNGPTIDKNLLLLTKALETNKFRPTAYFALARAQELSGNSTESLRTFEEGVALAPNIADSQWSLMEFCIYAKQFDCADRAFKKLREIQVARDAGPLAYWDQWTRLVDAYTQVEQWDRAIEFQKKTIETNPGGPTGDEYSRLAALYQKAGKIELARDAAKRAMAIDPSLAPDAQAFIDSLK
jgi:tetratricopeptide (TPR) repeat protein